VKVARVAIRRLLPLDPNDMRNTGQVDCPMKDSPIARQRCVEFQRTEGCVCRVGELAWKLDEQHQRDLREEQSLRDAASARYRAEYRANGADRQVKNRGYLERYAGGKCIGCGKKVEKGRATCGKKKCVRSVRAKTGGAFAASGVRVARMA
jgi:hypothetical protein